MNETAMNTDELPLYRDKKKDEVFLCTIEVEDKDYPCLNDGFGFESIEWKTKRKGSVIGEGVPVFIKKAELIEETEKYIKTGQNVPAWLSEMLE